MASCIFSLNQLGRLAWVTEISQSQPKKNNTAKYVDRGKRAEIAALPPQCIYTVCREAQLPHTQTIIVVVK